MKEKEEIKIQFDKLKEQHQKDKQKEQQKENEITKISQEKKILETVVKTGNCDGIKINHVSDKDQQIKDLKIQLQKEEDTGKILVKENVEMKSIINMQEIKWNQKKKKGRMSSMRLKKK